MSKNTTSKETVSTLQTNHEEFVESKNSENSKITNKKSLISFPSLSRAVYDSSLGISIVVAVILGFGFGYGMYKLTDIYFFIFIGLAYGIMAAILNVYKAYKRLKKDFEEIAQKEKYTYMRDKNEMKKA